MQEHRNAFSCLTKRCSHGSDPSCAAFLLEEICANAGNPELLCDPKKLALLFPIAPVTDLYPYAIPTIPEDVMRAWDKAETARRQTDPKAKAQSLRLSMENFLRWTHSDLLACYVPDKSFFANLKPGEVNAVVRCFNALLLSAGLRYVPASPDLRHIVADDPALDYGWQPGAAVKFRREGWGHGASDPRADAPASNASRSIMMMMYSVASCGRPDLAVELFACLANEKFATDVTLVKFPANLANANLRSREAAVRQEICSTCFTKASGFLFSRAAMAMRTLTIKAPRDEKPTGTHACCRCGLSLLRFRVRTETEPPVTIETCAHYIVWIWNKGCKGSSEIWRVS